VLKLDGTSPRIAILGKLLGGSVSLSAKHSVLQRGTIGLLLVGLFLLSGLTPAFSQEASTTDHGAPKYDLQTESKKKGIVDEVKLLTLGSRKDFVQLVVKSGEEKLSIFVCPKPFQDEMGITFTKGDEIAVTGSKVKQEEADVILARELVRGTDTLQFRDDKGKAVWDWRTGK
jgi:hypothetical protein